MIVIQIPETCGHEVNNKNLPIYCKDNHPDVGFGCLY